MVERLEHADPLEVVADELALQFAAGGIALFADVRGVDIGVEGIARGGDGANESRSRPRWRTSEDRHWRYRAAAWIVRSAGRSGMCQAWASASGATRTLPPSIPTNRIVDRAMAPSMDCVASIATNTAPIQHPFIPMTNPRPFRGNRVTIAPRF